MLSITNRPGRLTRKNRKRQFIVVKNNLRSAPFGHGEFVCGHELNPENRLPWTNFFFMSEVHHQCYFSVAMNTAQYEANHRLEQRISDELELTLPYAAQQAQPLSNRKISTRDLLAQRMHVFADRHKQAKILRPLMMLQEQTVRPEIRIKECRQGVISVEVTVDTPFIDEKVIRDFIEQFRGLGEPIARGLAWSGDEISLLPKEDLHNHSFRTTRLDPTRKPRSKRNSKHGR